MGRDTPVRKFAYEIERLTRLAYPELASDVGSPEQRDTQKNILNRIALEQFISGLPPMLSRPVVERQISDFEEAVRVAAHMEEDSWEFHPHNQNADEPVKPLRCIIEADRIGEGLMIGIANYTSRSYKFRNDEPLGFLTQAQVIPFSELLSPSTDEAPELSGLVTQLKERQYDAISKTIENQKTARRYQRDYYNRRARDKKYELGDLVYLYRPAVKPGDASKLTKKWEPGYVVVGLHDNGLTYEISRVEQHLQAVRGQVESDKVPVH
ncbi:hypothetical protein FJT64_023105 [Amphibalanus amphitrite]|uniref:Uncharacterized protein n=1 Tax=Amphibalanus amphitrite TaxID=1232801 RepID=A0A6A4WND7_AMPAM|nr:hypothetical protein FJT64_023105 [Amphibalanus amphitrite]